VNTPLGSMSNLKNDISLSFLLSLKYNIFYFCRYWRRKLDQTRTSNRNKISRFGNAIQRSTPLFLGYALRVLLPKYYHSTIDDKPVMVYMHIRSTTPRQSNALATGVGPSPKTRPCI
jgi:hypothetical protein